MISVISVPVRKNRNRSFGRTKIRIRAAKMLKTISISTAVLKPSRSRR